MKLFIIIIFLFSFNDISATSVGNETGLKIPRYISLKSNDTNIRVGPSINYPIVLKYVVKDFPLIINEEYNDWRKVKDFENNTGWIHKSLIKSERTGIIMNQSNESVYIYNTINGYEIGNISLKNIVKIKKCKKNWCFISIQDHKGWIDKDFLWGVEKDEVFNIGYQQILIDFFWRSLIFFNDLS